jgi:tRNA-splicing ligase RtcB (3'-phosphate/5'-hydroxy nucleic acid ligase)
VADGGVVSAGGVGFDISCGVRLLATSLHADEVRLRQAQLMAGLRRAVPVGMGAGGIWHVNGAWMDEVLRQGAVPPSRPATGTPRTSNAARTEAACRSRTPAR